MTMISEYVTSEEPLRAYERFAIYPGHHRRNKHIACRCKPTSVEDKYSEGLIAEIDELDDLPGHFRISIGNSTELFYVEGEEDSEMFALEACGVIFGIHPNMIVDVMSQPVRISREVYKVADFYDASNVAPLVGAPDDEEEPDQATVEPSSDTDEEKPKTRRKTAKKTKPAEEGAQLSGFSEGKTATEETSDAAIKRSDLEGAVEIDVMPSINSE